jgi:predicted Fe-Mo cluster-binding NifX family protein
MRIAVAVDTEESSANVSYYGGRAPHFLIFDESGRLIQAFGNPYVDIERHAGYELSQLLISENVDAVIAGLFGPIMINNLSKAGIKCVVKQGPAKDAVQEFVLFSDADGPAGE